MATYVYSIADGLLWSWDPSDEAEVAPSDVLTANGWAVARRLEALDDTHAWNASSKSVDVVPAPVPPNEIGAWKFTLLFTPAEFSAVSSSSDAIVKQFMYALGRCATVDLTNPVIEQAVGYCTQMGLLTPQRMASILSGKSPS